MGKSTKMVIFNGKLLFIVDFLTKHGDFIVIFHSFLYVLPEDIHHFCEQIMIFQRPTPRNCRSAKFTHHLQAILAPRRMATCWTENEQEIDTHRLLSTGMVLYPIFVATTSNVYVYIYMCVCVFHFHHSITVLHLTRVKFVHIIATSLFHSLSNYITSCLLIIHTLRLIKWTL